MVIEALIGVITVRGDGARESMVNVVVAGTTDSFPAASIVVILRVLLHSGREVEGVNV